MNKDTPIFFFRKLPHAPRMKGQASLVGASSFLRSPSLIDDPATCVTLGKVGSVLDGAELTLLTLISTDSVTIIPSGVSGL